jgi:pyruvate,water dikinase
MVNTYATTETVNSEAKETAFVLWFDEVGISDIPSVGGKNASLGEMIRELASQGVNVPNGFATTAYAYRYFIESAGLEKKLRELFADLDVEDMPNLRQRGKQARSLILDTPFPPELEAAITSAYKKLCERYSTDGDFCNQFGEEYKEECKRYSNDVGVPPLPPKTYPMPVLPDNRKPT